jgi:hypothetical protein
MDQRQGLARPAWYDRGMASAQFEVVSPEGLDIYAQSGSFPPAPPLDGLKGKKIGLVWTVFANGNQVLEAFADLLPRRYPGMQFVRLNPGRTAQWGDNPEPSITELAREQGIDAAIVAAGC